MESYRIVLIAVLLPMVGASVHQDDQGLVEGVVGDLTDDLLSGVTVRIHNER